jgi:hypothetical protein
MDGTIAGSKLYSESGARCRQKVPPRNKPLPHNAGQRRMPDLIVRRSESRTKSGIALLKRYRHYSSAKHESYENHNRIYSHLNRSLPGYIRRQTSQSRHKSSFRWRAAQ